MVPRKRKQNERNELQQNSSVQDEARKLLFQQCPSQHPTPSHSQHFASDSFATTSNLQVNQAALENQIRNKVSKQISTRNYHYKLGLFVRLWDWLQAQDYSSQK